MVPSLWNSLPAILRNVPTLSQFKSQLKTFFVCPGLPLESEEMCVCVWHLNVDGCIWIGRGGREREGGREHERSRQEKEARVGWVKRERLKLVSLFEIINILLIVVQVDERRLVCACQSLCVCVCVCIVQ